MTLLKEKNLGILRGPLSSLAAGVEPVFFAISEIVLVQIGLLGLPNRGTKRRVGENNVEAVFDEAHVAGFRGEIGGRDEAISSNDVGVPVVVDDHVHLSRARYLLVDFDAVELGCSKVVPMLVVRDGVESMKIAGLTAHLVECVKEESATAARGVEDAALVGDRQHVDDELYDGARREVLAEVATEKRTKECFKGAALAVEVGGREVDALKVADDLNGMNAG
jgi:hypothetical protein